MKGWLTVNQNMTLRIIRMGLITLCWIVLMRIVEASYWIIPFVCNYGRSAINNKKTLPKCEVDVKQLRSDTIYWYSKWVNKDRVNYGLLYKTIFIRENIIMMQLKTAKQRNKK